MGTEPKKVFGKMIPKIYGSTYFNRLTSQQQHTDQFLFEFLRLFEVLFFCVNFSIRKKGESFEKYLLLLEKMGEKVGFLYFYFGLFFFWGQKKNSSLQGKRLLDELLMLSVTSQSKKNHSKMTSLLDFNPFFVFF